MTKTCMHLNIDLLTIDGLSSQFYQPDENCVHDALRHFNNPRLFIQPKWVFASENHVSTITSHSIAIILARTNCPLPPIFPLNSPAGPVYVTEAGDDWGHDELPLGFNDRPHGGPENSGWRSFRVEFNTLGGWKGALEVRAQDRGTAVDRQQTFAHYLELPVIPFKLRAGGVGLINPANLTWVSSYPAPDALPKSALRMESVRPPIRSGITNIVEIS